MDNNIREEDNKNNNGQQSSIQFRSYLTWGREGGRAFVVVF